MVTASEGSVHALLAPRQKQRSRRPWGRRPAQPSAAKKEREEGPLGREIRHPKPRGEELGQSCSRASGRAWGPGTSRVWCHRPHLGFRPCDPAVLPVPRPLCVMSHLPACGDVYLFTSQLCYIGFIFCSPILRELTELHFSVFQKLVKY